MSEDHDIPFNRPWITGKELENIESAIRSRQLAGDGNFSVLCHRFFRDEFGFRCSGLTASCTDALEMTAILLNIKQGDEVIMPSYTFVSTANAFILRGATIRFADSLPDQPNVDPESIAALINERTRAIVAVHYAGVACNMRQLSEITRNQKIDIVEDAAHSIGSYYYDQPLGSIGTFGTFSFHESKNISSGEGGLLAINDDRYFERGEIIREKGTNRGAFFRGETDKYGWLDVGSSFLPSNITAAFLYAQLLDLKSINAARVSSWNRYYANLKGLTANYPVQLPVLPEGTTNNGHMFYLVCDSLETRTALIRYLGEKKIHAAFHYQSLHASAYFRKQHDGRVLSNSDRYSDCLVRLPMYCGLPGDDVDRVSDAVIGFFAGKK